jgi:molecular chaperone GrpE
MIINHQDKNKNVTDHDISTESDDKVVVDTATPEDVGDEPEQEVVSEQLIGSEGLDNVDADREEAIDDDVLPSYEELQTELAAAKDQLLRSLAEGENIRRRAERDKIESSKYAITNFARQIITVADNLTRALGSVSEEARGDNEELNNFFIGIEMTDKELMNSFEQANIKVVNSIGQKFDHNVHQAMFEVDDREQPAGMVVQEIQKGYLLHDRLLRPAMVGVSKGGPKPDTEEETLQVADATLEKPANDISSAYEKQAGTADQVSGEIKTKLDKKL